MYKILAIFFFAVWSRPLRAQCVVNGENATFLKSGK